MSKKKYINTCIREDGDKCPAWAGTKEKPQCCNGNACEHKMRMEVQ